MHHVSEVDDRLTKEQIRNILKPSVKSVDSREDGVVVEKWLDQFCA